MDTAAEDAVIGSNAMNRLRGSLRAMGLRAIPATGVELPGAGGIVGAAVVHSMMDVPIGVAGHNCILRFTVLKDTGQFETPPLLPVSFLETMDTIIDFQKSECVIGGNTVEMIRLPTGHRAIDILQYHPDGGICQPRCERTPTWTLLCFHPTLHRRRCLWCQCGFNEQMIKFLCKLYLVGACP